MFPSLVGTGESLSAGTIDEPAWDVTIGSWAGRDTAGRLAPEQCCLNDQYIGNIPNLYGDTWPKCGMVDDWTDSMTARQRVETIATTLDGPRSANWVATQAEVKWDTAKKHLDNLANAGSLLRTDDDKYAPDPTRAYFDALRDLILDHSREDLRAELEAIADRIGEWKTEFDVESIGDLESSLADDRELKDVRRRRRTIRRWENSLRTRQMIRTALVLYDDVRSRASAIERIG